jgi:hypothetical protein
VEEGSDQPRGYAYAYVLTDVEAAKIGEPLLTWPRSSARSAGTPGSRCQSSFRARSEGSQYRCHHRTGLHLQRVHRRMRGAGRRGEHGTHRNCRSTAEIGLAVPAG